MCLISRVDENLCLCLRELTKTYHSLAWGYLIAVGFTYLGGAKGQMVTVEFNQAREIHEHSLCGLRAKVSCPLSAWSYCCFEHEIELICVAKFSSAFRAFDIVLAYN